MTEIKKVINELKNKNQMVSGLDRNLLNKEILCIPGCEICGGSGYYRVQVPVDDPGFGKMLICQNVDRSTLPGIAPIGLVREEISSLTWDVLVNEPGVKKSIQAVRETIKRGHGWVFLYGGFGVGKTFIQKIAVAEVIRSGKEAAYVRMAEILDHLRESFQEGIQESENERLDYWSKIPVLAIDEFDRARNTEYMNERRFVLMDRRYEGATRENSITILSSNEDPSNLPGYLYDRVRDGRFKIICLSGESFRPGMNYTEPENDQDKLC